MAEKPRFPSSNQRVWVFVEFSNEAQSISIHIRTTKTRSISESNSFEITDQLCRVTEYES